MSTKTKLMTEEFKAEVKAYALKDTELTLRLWQKYHHEMPQQELLISQMTREMGMRGVPVNLDKLRAAETTLIAAAEAAKAKLPWVGGDLPPLSLQAIRNQCEIEGIEAPSTFAEKSTEGAEWEAKYADKYPWVTAVRDFRKANKHLKTVQTMISRTRPDGRMGYELKYFGAATGRDSGGGGWNAQNTPKGTVAGVDIRSMIEAPEGKTLIIADLAQIEARVLSYLARDTVALDLISSGVDVYEAHARATMGYTDPRPLKDVDPKMRQLAKARCLAGTTPVLTDRGYFTIAELQTMPCLRVWDGLCWCAYEQVITTGEQSVSNFNGEHFTDNHEIFTRDGQTKPIGAIFEGPEAMDLLGRNPPGGDWADVWKLACFVARSLSREWISLCKGYLHRMRERICAGVVHDQKRPIDAVRGMRDQESGGHKKHRDMGTPDGRPGPGSEPAVGRHDAALLRPVEPQIQKLWWARN